MPNDHESAFCPNCGATVGTQDRFCDQCGAGLRDTTDLSVSHKPDDGTGSAEEAERQDAGNPMAKIFRHMPSQGNTIPEAEDDPEVAQLKVQLAAAEREVQLKLEKRRAAEEAERQRAEKQSMVDALSQRLEEVEAKLAELEGTEDKS